MLMNPITITIAPVFLLIAAIIKLILLYAAFKFGEHVGRLDERSNRLETIEEDGIQWEDV